MMQKIAIVARCDQTAVFTSWDERFHPSHNGLIPQLHLLAVALPLQHSVVPVFDGCVEVVRCRVDHGLPLVALVDLEIDGRQLVTQCCCGRERWRMVRSHPLQLLLSHLFGRHDTKSSHHGSTIPSHPTMGQRYQAIPPWVNDTKPSHPWVDDTKPSHHGSTIPSHPTMGQNRVLANSGIWCNAHVTVARPFS